MGFIESAETARFSIGIESFPDPEDPDEIPHGHDLSDATAEEINRCVHELARTEGVLSLVLDIKEAQSVMLDLAEIPGCIGITVDGARSRPELNFSYPGDKLSLNYLDLKNIRIDKSSFYLLMSQCPHLDGLKCDDCDLAEIPKLPDKIDTANFKSNRIRHIPDWLADDNRTWDVLLWSRDFLTVAEAEHLILRNAQSDTETTVKYPFNAELHLSNNMIGSVPPWVSESGHRVRLMFQSSRGDRGMGRTLKIPASI